jgi:hypothetical protein
MEAIAEKMISSDWRMTMAGFKRGHLSLDFLFDPLGLPNLQVLHSDLSQCSRLSLGSTS